SLVLLGSGPDALPSPRADVLRLLRPVVEQAGLAAVADASDGSHWGGTPSQASFLTEALADADRKRGPQPAEVRAFLRERLLRGSAAALVAMADALLGEPDRVDALAATRVPVLVAHGEDDDAWSPAVQRVMADRLGAAYEVVPDALHSPAAENPDGTAKVLLAFWG
nr:alpha/beta hydrolase [Actinomycetota bacterium]